MCVFVRVSDTDSSLKLQLNASATVWLKHLPAWVESSLHDLLAERLLLGRYLISEPGYAHCSDAVQTRCS